MYKSGVLFGFISSDGLFFAVVETYKYEIGVYCYCKNREDVDGRRSVVQGGWPTCDNGVHCKNSVGQLWFEVLKMALEFEHDVYPGNDFKV